MIDREKLEFQFERLTKCLLEYIEENLKTDADLKDALIRAEWYTPFAEALGACALYESSKAIETYSKRLHWLTVALAGLTLLLLIRTFWSS
jgi:hypothetical protein